MHIRSKTIDPLLENSDLLRVMLGNVIFQTVFLACMVRLHQFQLRYLNVQIHLFLDIWVACGKCLYLCIGKCRFIHIFAASHRGFTGHDLADEFLLVLYELSGVTVKRTFRNITKDLNLVILIALS